MTDQPNYAERSKNIRKITIDLPIQLAERAERYAKENGNTITGVVIEALDTFLRGNKLDVSWL